jgi:phage tail-like protein
MVRVDPLQGSRFRLEIDGLTAGNFAHASIGASAVELIEYREGTDPPHARKLPGLARFGNVVLKRGLTESTELYEWYAQVVSGQIAGSRRSVAIVIMDDAGADRARFRLREAWPVRYETSPLDALANQVVIETLEIAHEGIERIS